MKKTLSTSFIFLVTFTINLFSKDYYVSPKGSDKNNGTSEKSPFQTINKINCLILNPGDKILFQRGGIYRGETKIKSSGTIDSPITFGAYGTGPLPILSGTVPIKKWKKYKGAIYYSAIKDTVHALFRNGKEMVISRYPNAGFLSIDSSINKSSFKGAYPSYIGEVAGANIHIRTSDWSYENRKVISSIENIFLYDSPTQYKPEKGYGYFLSGKLEFIDTLHEWSFDPLQKKIFFFSQSDPNLIETEGSVYRKCFSGKGLKNIVFENLKITGYSEAGIIGDNAINIKIKNCDFANIQKSAIAFNEKCEDIELRKNNFQQINGRGIFLQNAVHCEISENILKNVGLYPGVGISGVNNMVAILVDYGSNNIVRNNQIDSCGYVGIRTDGKHSITEYNLVKNSMLKLNDGAAIYCFGPTTEHTHHNIIRNNIVIGGGSKVEATPKNKPAFQGIYLDNNVHHIVVENNTVANILGNGILVNDRTFNNDIKGNLLFNNRDAGIHFSEWSAEGTVFANDTKENIIYSSGPEQICISTVSSKAPIFNPGAFDSNYYFNTSSNHIIKKQTRGPDNWIQNTYTLEEWQNASGQDMNSKSFKNITISMSEEKPLLLVNEEKNAKTIGLDSKIYSDSNKKFFKNEVTLPGFSSLLLFPIEQ